MNDNIRKIFDMLGVEPNEKFKVKDAEGISKETLYFDESLFVHGDSSGLIYINFLNKVLNGTLTIIKLPKKKKLRDLTLKEYEKWVEIGCHRCDRCDNCVFKNVICIYGEDCWVHHKDLYSDIFLDQEIEVE